MNRLGKVFIALGCVAALAVASSFAQAKKTIKIALIAKSSTNPVFLSARTGAEAAAKELSAKYNIDIVIDWRTPPTEDGQVQAQRIAQHRYQRFARVHIGLLQSRSERAFRQRRGYGSFQVPRSFRGPRRYHSIGADLAGDPGTRNVGFCHKNPDESALSI